VKTFLPFMTSVEAQEAVERGAIAIVPIGTVEGNGPHQLLGADYLIAEVLAERVSEQTNDVWLPSIAYGVSEMGVGTPGTISLPHPVFAAVVENVMLSLITQGFDHILLLTGHVPNLYPVEFACREVRRRTGVLVASISPGPLATDLSRDVIADETYTGHGGEPGVSIMMHAFPGNVRTDLMNRAGLNKVEGILKPMHPTDTTFGKSKVNFYIDLHEITAAGSTAAPTKASAERGEVVLGRMVEYVVEFLGTFRGIDTRNPWGKHVADAARTE
jgi:creatinine amidohydrolase